MSSGETIPDATVPEKENENVQQQSDNQSDSELPISDGETASTNSTPTENSGEESVVADVQSTSTGADSETEVTEVTVTANEEKSVASRVRLNPTFRPSSVKAVPTFQSQSVSPTPARSVEQPAVADVPSGASTEEQTAATKKRSTGGTKTTESAGSESAGPSYLPAEAESALVEIPQRGPVDIPPDDTDLDEDLEAQIAAAMSDDDSQARQIAAAQAEQVANAETSESETAEARATTEEELEEGTRLKGKIQSIDDENIFLDLGYRSPGVVPARQFAEGKKPLEGQLVEVIFEKFDPNEGLIFVNLSQGLRRAGGNWDALSAGQIVDCMVTRTNKGGLEVTVGSLRGFMPASQVELHFVSDLEGFVGQKLRCQVSEVNPKKRNLVVSRRALLQAERAEKEEEVWKTIELGQTLQGTIKTIKDYGAFVEIGGVDGFLHIGEIGWTHIKHPSEAISEGQQVDVKILSLDEEKKRIGLGMRQLIANPWETAETRYAKGMNVSGTVTRIADFGAFVELEPGIEGLVHISELDHKRVNQVSDVLSAGQDVELQVLEVSRPKKRISLSLKALVEKPVVESQQKESEPEQTPLGNRRKRKGSLKGGIGDSGAGGLFGNPTDYK